MDVYKMITNRVIESLEQRSGLTPKKGSKTMKPKLTEYKSGALAVMEKLFPSGMYLVYCRNGAGELIDKTRCDDYRMALDYYAAFKRVAKAA